MAARVRRGWERLGDAGQILVGVMLLLVVMATLVPLMVLYTQREAKWSAKQDQNTTAFHLAESGVEKGYRALSASTATWYALTENGTQIDRFHFDYLFDDVVGGVYAVAIASGPEDRQATVYAVGKDSRNKEVRALKVIYGQNILDDVAIQAMEGVSVAGGVSVEWGAVIGQEHVDTNNSQYPQFHSATSLSIDTDPNPPNCDQPDCCQWFSFSQDLPPDPEVDISFYRSSAQALTSGCPSGGVDYGSGPSCYFDSAQAWNNVSYSQGGTVFIENNATIGSPGVDILGNFVITGNLTTTSGGWGKGSVDMAMPQTAWKQYCNNWSHYTSNFDGDAPSDFPGLEDPYLSSATITYNPNGNKCAVQGFLYVGGNFTTSGGGGGAEIYGTMFVAGSVSVAANSPVTVYYNKDAAEGVKTLRLVLSRVSWQDEVRQWPSNL